MTTPRKLLYVSAQPCPPSLQDHLRQRAWEVVHARSLKAAKPLLRQHGMLVALLVLGSAWREVAADFEACREASDLCEWVGLLPAGALDSAPIRDMVVRNFFDHHTHPADAPFLCQSLGHAFGRATLRSGRSVHAADNLGLVGRSAAMGQLRRLLRKAAGADAPVLIEGESGTGKELAARALHDASARAAGPFVVLNCGALAGEPREVFECAAGGTLLLDHVADLPLDWQARLLRFMAEMAVVRAKLGRGAGQDVRIVATCEAPLADAVAAKRFRQDLFFRLNVLPVAMPPLRQRKDDIPLLAQHFHAKCLHQCAGGAKGFSREALAALKEHAWPGNVRELLNRVQRAVLLAERRLMGPADLGLQERAPQPLDSLETIRIEAEKNALALSLDRFSHNISLAARELGVSRMTMYRLMAKHSMAPRAA